MVRYTVDGALDTTFDDDGRVTNVFQGGIYDLAVQTDGRIVAGGSSSGAMAFARYLENGTPDASFSGDGRATVSFDADSSGAAALALQPDGRIVATGNVLGTTFAMARLTAAGAPDPSFDGDGRLTTSFGPASGYAADVVLQSDGRIVVSGAYNDDLAMARYNTGGSLDPDFGGDGRVTTDVGPSDVGVAVALQPDGRIVASGHIENPADTFLARYLGGGGVEPPVTVDLSVNKTGSTTVSLGDQAVYTITVTNTSTTTTATGVSVSDSITGGSGTMISATPSQGGACTLTATTATCPLGTIAPGASASFTLRVEPRATGTLWDGAAIGAVDQDDPNTANDSRVFATTVNNARGCTIVGTSSFETINGTAGNDVICALSGSDTVNAGGGSDTVYAGPGNDLVNGGSGNDRLIGQSGNDRLNGDAGNDTLDTRDSVASNDAAYGGFGFDTCTTDPGDIRNSCP
ncbi:hypothetical protein [Streptomyces tritici]|uniref:hypothetical protein n=1 Tax=Streptomyces tritici TaxID=2054410 RepID=UPI003AF04763